jgi:hypothetical protein
MKYKREKKGDEARKKCRWKRRERHREIRKLRWRKTKWKQEKNKLH